MLYLSFFLVYSYLSLLFFLFFFFFNDTATTEIYTTYDTLSLHDALPTSCSSWPARRTRPTATRNRSGGLGAPPSVRRRIRRGIPGLDARARPRDAAAAVHRLRDRKPALRRGNQYRDLRSSGRCGWPAPCTRGEGRLARRRMDRLPFGGRGDRGGARRRRRLGLAPLRTHRRGARVEWDRPCPQTDLVASPAESPPRSRRRPLVLHRSAR